MSNKFYTKNKKSVLFHIYVTIWQTFGQIFLCSNKKLTICSIYKQEQVFYIIRTLIGFYCGVMPMSAILNQFNNPNLQDVDLICMHSKKGDIIPLRIRVTDEDGLPQVYSIKKYKDLSHHGCIEMPDGVYVTDNTLIFECSIVIFGSEKTVRLYNDPPKTVWKLSPVRNI